MADLRHVEADLETIRQAHYAAGDEVNQAQGKLYEASAEVGKLEAEIREHHARLTADAGPMLPVAVRSSATAEDLPDASFAGQQETFLNIRGVDQVIEAIHHVFASLYNDRAIAYRVHQGFAHAHVALSAAVQRMVRSDTGAAGVVFTLDTESGFPDVVFVTASYGLGEMVVQGAVNPDEFYVHKPALKAGKFPIIRRNLGSKLQRMEFATPEEKAAAGAALRKLPRDSSATRVRNRCNVSGRPRAFLRHFGLSRIALRDMALNGLIPGVRKASW